VETAPPGGSPATNGRRLHCIGSAVGCFGGGSTFCVGGKRGVYAHARALFGGSGGTLTENRLGLNNRNDNNNIIIIIL